MKVCMTCDVHGTRYNLDYVKSIIDTVDHVVIGGDYYDSHNTAHEDYDELIKEYIELKKQYPEKVTLLLGNHDIWYLTELYETWAGHEPEYNEARCKYLTDNIQYFDIFYKCDNWLFSHAGFSKSWVTNPEHTYTKARRKDEKLMGVYGIRYIPENPHPPIALDKPIGILENIRQLDKLSPVPDGNHIDEGPCWIRPNALTQDGIVGYNQCVSHTAIAREPVVTSTAKLIEKSPTIEHYFTGRENALYVFVETSRHKSSVIIDTITNEITPKVLED